MTPDDHRLAELVARLDLVAKVRLLTGADHWALHAEPRIGLRSIVTADGPSGVRGVRWDEREPSASLPSATAVAASWDERSFDAIAAVLASEAAGKGVDVVLGPTVNLHRTPLAGRAFECFSEDPLLSGRLGTAYVRALQERGIAATPKHYVANDSETERFTLDVQVDERTLHEVYLAPFEQIVTRARPWLVMAAYNQVDGTTMTESPLLAEPLKGEWGFDGVVVSDWHAGRTTEPAANAALDLVMPGPDGPWGEALVAAVRAGTVPEQAIDDKVLRLLRLAARLGALEDVDTDGGSPPRLDDAEVAAVTREVATSGMVLLHNDGLLPLHLDGLDTVAVIGPNARDARIQGGGSARVFPRRAVSPLEGLTAALEGAATVVHEPGATLLRGLRPLDAGLAVDPVTGGGGLHVRWLDATAEVIGEEERLQGRLRWSETIPAGAHAVEVTARIQADVGGRWRLGVLGLGSYAISVDGRPRARETLVADVDQFDAAVHRRKQLAVDVDLEPGRQVELEVTAEVPGDRSFGLGFEVGAERPPIPDEQLRAEAVRVAAAADVAVVVVGTTEQVESEGFDRTTLALPGTQDELVRAVAAANPRTVVVVNAGAPVLMPWRDEVAAVLVAWFGGQELGHALGDVLLGVEEPGGRLPMTWPAREDDVPVPDPTPVDGVLHYAEGLHVGHRGWDRDGSVPAHRFGEGQGYTTWHLDDLAVPASVDLGEGPVHVRVRVTNTGGRAGKQVVQVYASCPGSALERPVRWLAGFAVVRADPGEVVDVEVAVDRRAFEHWDVSSGRFVVEPGTFELSAGFSSGDLPHSAAVQVDTSTQEADS